MKPKNWLFGRDGALFRAAAIGQLGLAKELVAAGADVNVASISGFTPLHRAAQNGHQEVVKFLVSAGATPAVSAQDNSTPVSLAEKNGHLSIVGILRQQLQHLSGK